MNQDYDKQKPEKRLWPFATVLMATSFILFVGLYYWAVTNDSLIVPLAFISVSVPFGLFLKFLLSLYFENETWRLRDIYRFRAYLEGKFLGFVFGLGMVSFIIVGGVSFTEPDLYGLGRSGLFIKSKLDFETAQAVHRSYMILFYVAYFFLVHSLVKSQIKKKENQLTYSPISIPNKSSEYHEKGYYTEFRRFFGEKYINLNGDLIKSEELEEWLTDISTDSLKWPNNDFIPATQFTTRKILIPKENQ